MSLTTAPFLWRHGAPTALLALGLSLALLASTAVTASADTELGHTGKVGKHSLDDSKETPGVLCEHHTRGGRLKTVIVFPPNIEPRTDLSQEMGWRFVMQRRAAPGKKWLKFYTSTITKGRLYDQSGDLEMVKTVSPTFPSKDTKASRYRVIVIMFWYRPDGSQAGSARHRGDWYGPYGAEGKGQLGGCKAAVL